MNRAVVFVFSLALSLGVAACGELFDAKVSGIQSGGNSNTATVTTPTGNSNATDSNASNGNTVTGNANTSNANTTTGNTNATTGTGSDSNATVGDASNGNSLVSALGCTPATVTYSGQVSSALTSNCLSCHSGGQQPNLGTYAQAQAAFQTGGAMDRVTSSTQPMPPGGASSALKCTFANWIANNYAQ